MGCDRRHIPGKAGFRAALGHSERTGIVDRSAQRVEVAKAEGRVDSLEPLVSGAPFRLCFHGSSNLYRSQVSGYSVC